MAITINTNTSSLIAAQRASKANQTLTNSLERIATGKRINSAADDASGMTIADSLRSQSLAAGQEIQNANASIAIAQTAEGALGEMTDILQDIRTKTIAAANGSQSQDSLTAIQSDINGSMEALRDIVSTTSYNGQTLLDGTFNSGDLSIGSVSPDQLGSAELGSLAGINVTSEQGAQDALSIIDEAMEQVGQVRSDLGSRQNQYLSEIENLTTTRVNLMSAESQIRDTDLAEESIILNQAKILRQASIYATVQAGKSSQHLIDLLG